LMHEPSRDRGALRRTRPQAWRQGQAPRRPSKCARRGRGRQGSCGYGMLNKGVWPYWSVAALSSGNSFSVAGPVQGCGRAPASRHLRARADAARCSAAAAPRLTAGCLQLEPWEQGCHLAQLTLQRASPHGGQAAAPLGVAGRARASGGANAPPVRPRRQCFQIQCVDRAPFQGRCITGSEQARPHLVTGPPGRTPCLRGPA
jgi:hypothetical protein